MFLRNFFSVSMLGFEIKVSCADLKLDFNFNRALFRGVIFALDSIAVLCFQQSEKTK